MIPGVQNPHWLPPVAQSASAQFDAPASPSSVVIDRPADMVFIEDALVANVVALHDRLRAEAAAAAAR